MKQSLCVLLILITGLSNCSSGKHEEARERSTRFLIEKWHWLLDSQIWAGEGIPIGSSIEVLQELSSKHKMYDKDLWGQKFIYSYDGRPETFHFYSSGPNRIDEGGHGDDIVEESETRFIREALSIMEKRMERGPDAGAIP